ncbi:MAG: hypothetical protein SNJ67_14665, partial [Chloracidobacterium sp.]
MSRLIRHCIHAQPLVSAMGIFCHIDRNNLPGAFGTVAKAILDRRKARSLASHWSSAELVLDEEDFRFLVSLLRKADEKAIEQNLKPQRAKEFGLVFLCFAAEVARRFASEGEVWSVISKRFKNEAAHRWLFSATHQPRQRLKDAIEMAARHYEMRHVFGMQNVSNWYQTIYLQFGFTKNGFVRRLPEWLARQSLPEAVEALLSDERLRSPSFADLWQTLRDFRRNNITEENARKKLASSGWVLPDWIDELLKQARQRLDLPDRPTDQPRAEAEDPKFLSNPRLDLRDGAPRFLSEVVNLAQLDALSDDIYELHIGNDKVSKLTRQKNDSYAADIESIPLHCAPMLKAALVSCASQETKYCQIIELWNADDDVTLFGADGKRLDAWNERLRTDKTYYLLAADDLIFTLETTWWRIAEGWNLYELPAGWPPDVRLTFDDGETLWKPLIDAARSEPTWAWCNLFVESIDEKSAKVQVNASSEVTIHSIRCGSRLSLENNRCAVPLASFGRTGSASLRIRLQRGDETCVVRQRVSLDSHLPEPLVLALGDDGWRKLDGDKLSSAEAKHTPYKFFLPKSWKGEEAEWVLMEGDLWLKLPRGLQPLRGLAGFGAALTLRVRLYNVTDEGFNVSKAVIAQGCVKDIEFDEATRVISVCFRQYLEPSDDFVVVAWTQTGHLYRLCVSAPDEASRRWACVVPDDFTDPVTVAVAFRGEWMGAWFRDGADQWLPGLLAALHLEHRLKAALLRWFHLPLLSKAYEPSVRKFAKKHPVETCAAWLRDRLVELPYGLKFADRDDAWLSVVRAMFRDWQPQSEDAKALFDVWMEKAET